MARRALVALALAAAFASVAGTARAQAYESLHVRSFTMSVDRSSVALGEPFHLTIETKVDERVLQIDDLTLPDLAGFDSLGDERRCVAGSGGSDCVEIVTLAATIAGQRTIPGATLDAIDARNGKPSRFTSDSVAILVTGGTGDTAVFADFVFGALRAAVICLFVVVAVLAILWGFTKRRKAAPVVASAYVPPAPAPAPPPDPNARMRELVAELEREPTRANALRVRHALRAGLGARDDETYADLASRHGASPAALRTLAAVERAAFCEDDRVADAVREALPFLNA